MPVSGDLSPRYSPAAAASSSSPPTSARERSVPSSPTWPSATPAITASPTSTSTFTSAGWSSWRPKESSATSSPTSGCGLATGSPCVGLAKANGQELEEILDFGHAPVFEDADTFPCIIVAHRRAPAASEAAPLDRVCPIPRDRPAELSLDNYVHEHGFPVPWSRYGAGPWSLEPPEVDGLMQKIRERGVPLAELVGAKPLYGIKTGLNEAFLIDDATRAALIRDDPACADIIKPYLRGQDIKRWSPAWQGLWMIVLKSSADFDWPWSAAGENAESVFARTFPSLYRHMKALEERLIARQDRGRFWWELRSCDYYRAFDEPKIVHTDIAWRPRIAYSDAPLCCQHFPTSAHPRLVCALAAMNSPLMCGPPVAERATRKGRGSSPVQLLYDYAADCATFGDGAPRGRGARRRGPGADPRLPTCNRRAAALAAPGAGRRAARSAPGGLRGPVRRRLRREGPRSGSSRPLPG